MDFDVRPEHNVIPVAAGNRVVALSMDTLDVINSFEMPAPMHFHKEGGVAMHPHGSKFMAVSGHSLLYVFIGRMYSEVS